MTVLLLLVGLLMLVVLILTAGGVISLLWLAIATLLFAGVNFVALRRRKQLAPWVEEMLEDARVRKAGLREGVLVLLGREGRALPPQALANHLGISQGEMNETLTVMAKDGLIEPYGGSGCWRLK